MARKQEIEDPIKIEVKMPKELVYRIDKMLMFYNKNRSALIREFCDDRLTYMEMVLNFYFTNLAGYYLHKEIIDIEQLIKELGTFYKEKKKKKREKKINVDKIYEMNKEIEKKKTDIIHNQTDSNTYKVRALEFNLNLLDAIQRSENTNKSKQWLSDFFKYSKVGDNELLLGKVIEKYVMLCADPKDAEQMMINKLINILLKYSYDYSFLNLALQIKSYHNFLKDLRMGKEFKIIKHF